MTASLQPNPSLIFNAIHCNLTIDASGCAYSWALATGKALLVTAIFAAAAYIVLAGSLKRYRTTEGLTESIPHFRSIQSRVTKGVSSGSKLGAALAQGRILVLTVVSVAFVFFGINLWAASMGMTEWQPPFFYGGAVLVAFGAVPWYFRRITIGLTGRRTGWPQVAFAVIVNFAWIASIGKIRGSALSPPVGFAPGIIGFAPLTFVIAALLATAASRRIGSRRHELIAEERSHSEDDQFALLKKSQHGSLALWDRDNQPGALVGFISAAFWPMGLKPIFERENTLVVGPDDPEMSGRVLAPAIAMRNGPAVVVSSSADLARQLAPIVKAQGSIPIWWDPTDTFVPPAPSLPVTWDLLSPVNHVESALRAAEILVGAIVHHDSMDGSTDEVDQATHDRAVSAAAALMLASKFSGRASGRAGHWIDAGPELWSEAVDILRTSAEPSAHELGSTLVRVIGELRTDSGKPAMEILSKLATTLSVCEDTGLVDGDHLQPGLFVESSADVIFVIVPPGDRQFVIPAVELLLEQLTSRHSHDRFRRGPLTIVIDNLVAHSIFNSVTRAVESNVRSGTVFIGSLVDGSHPDRSSERGGLEAVKDIFPAKLFLPGTSVSDIVWLTSAIGGDTPTGPTDGGDQINLHDTAELGALMGARGNGKLLHLKDGQVGNVLLAPWFSEEPWASVSAAAVEVLDVNGDVSRI